MIKYVALPNPTINMTHIYSAAKIVDAAFATGYFNNHLNEIQCAWIVLDDDTVVGWAAVSDCMLRCVVVRPDGTCMSCKNLENFGFKLEKELDNYYNETRMKCKYCDTNCNCVARLYLKRKEDV